MHKKDFDAVVTASKHQKTGTLFWSIAHLLPKTVSEKSGYSSAKNYFALFAAAQRFF